MVFERPCLGVVAPSCVAWTGCCIQHSINQQSEQNRVHQVCRGYLENFLLCYNVRKSKNKRTYSYDTSFEKYNVMLMHMVLENYVLVTDEQCTSIRNPKPKLLTMKIWQDWTSLLGIFLITGMGMVGNIYLLYHLWKSKPYSILYYLFGLDKNLTLVCVLVR